jgi:hypothetical protein
MKKHISILLIALLLLGMAACQKSGDKTGDNPEPSASEAVSQKDTLEEKPDFDTELDTQENGSGENSQGSSPENDLVYNDELIKEICSEEGSYTDEVDNTYQYSYHVPALIADTPDAQSINDKLSRIVSERVEGEMSCMKQGVSLTCLSVSWKSYWSGSWVFLVVKEESDWEFDDYTVFCYDFETGKQVTNEEVLKSLGVSQQEFLDAMGEAAEVFYQDFYREIPEEERENFGYNQQLAWTLSDENLNLDLMMYLDEKGALAVITPIGSLAGASWYYHVLYPFAK